MKLLRKFLKPKRLEQTYIDDRRYIYNLMLAKKQGACWSRVFSTSVPLSINNSVVLAHGKSFLVIGISHVVYPKNVVERLTRPTTLIHAGITPGKDTVCTESDLLESGFTIVDSIYPYTVH